MKDRNLAGQRGDTAKHLAVTESSLQSRGYNGQAGQETNHDVRSESYIELLSGDLKPKSSMQAKHLSHHTGSTSKSNLWITSKGSRWTSAWENLRLQVDDASSVKEAKELYQSTEVADEISPPIDSLQIEKKAEDFTYSRTPYMPPRLAIRKDMGTKGSIKGKPKTDNILPSNENEDTRDPPEETLHPEAKSSLQDASTLPAEVPKDCNPLEMPTESATEPVHDVSDDEFLEKLQFADTSIEEELALHTDTPLNTEIHILGTGPIGLHIAHSLSSSPNPPPVTLLMHRPLLMQIWHEEGAAIRVVKDGTIYSSSNLNIESSAPFGVDDGTSDRRYAGFGEHLEHTIEQPNTRISNLIVTTRAQQTIAALTAIKHRLDYNSTICFVNSGMGIIEEVNELIFPNADSRPFYMQARNSHNIRPINNHTFSVVEQEIGDISFTICNRTVEAERIAPTIVKTHMHNWVPSSRYLLRRFTTIPEICATGYPKHQFLRDHLEKVATNCIIGPSSVMYDCFANELLYNYSMSEYVTSLLEEVSSVLISLPEMEKFAGRFNVFSVDRLRRITMNQCKKVGRNRTPMWHDVNQGRKTDIDYYNGYIIKRGNELGIDCTQLQLLVKMVKAKQMMKKQASEKYIMWDGGFRK